jgi:hypothetical protein
MKEGSTGIQKWISDVNAQGFAAQQAAGKMNSLNGDFKKLQAAVETGLIQMGAAADGFLRPVVQGLTTAITAFNGLPEPAKAAGMAFGAMAGAGLLLGGMLLTTIPKVYESVQAFKALEAASPRLADGIKSVGKASLVAAGLIAALQVAQAIGKNFETAAKSTDEMAQSMLALNKSGAQASDVFGKDMFKSSNGRKFVDDVEGVGMAIKQVTGPDVIDNINDFGNTILGVFGGLHKDTQLDKTRASIKNIDAAMSNFVGSGSAEVAATNFKKMADEAEKQGVKTEETAKAFPQYMDSLRKLASDMKVPLDQQELLNWALGEVPQKMLDAQNSTEGQAKMAEVAAKATEAQQKALDALGIAADGTIVNLDNLVTSMINSGLITLSARDAARNFEKSIDDLDDSLKKNGTTLDITTQKGRDNQAAFDGIAGAGLKSAEAMAKAGESQAAVQGNLRGTYDSLIAAAGKFGITGDEADTMARKVMGVPKDVPIDTAIQNFADSMAKLQAIKDKADGLNGKRVDVGIYTTEYFDTLDRRSAPTVVDPNKLGGHYADGGALDSAPGPKGVDSKLFWGAKGEHVLTDNDVDAMGGQAAVYAFRKQLHNGGVRPSYGAPAPSAPAAIGGFSGGGPVAMSGTLVLDSGELMGTFTGVANQVADAKLDQVSRQVGGMRR